MAKSSLGKAVSRVGAAGGGRSYRKARPGGYYGILGLIVVLGLVSITYSRYERAHPYITPTAFPAKNSTGYVGLAVDVCGTREPNLATGFFTGTAFTQEIDNVILINPITAAESGSNHVTLAAYLAASKKIIFSANALSVPAGPKTAAHTYDSGTVCPAGTLYHGKKAVPIIATWATAAQSSPTVGTATGIGLTQGELVTIAFVPEGATPFQPSALTVSTVLNDVSQLSSTTTTTTIAGTSTTIAPTTVPSTSTSTTTSTTTPATTTTTS